MWPLSFHANACADRPNTAKQTATSTRANPRINVTPYRIYMHDPVHSHAFPLSPSMILRTSHEGRAGIGVNVRGRDHAGKSEGPRSKTVIERRHGLRHPRCISLWLRCLTIKSVRPSWTGSCLYPFHVHTSVRGIVPGWHTG